MMRLFCQWLRIGLWTLDTLEGRFQVGVDGRVSSSKISTLAADTHRL
jgi:hypothetical protein